MSRRAFSGKGTRRELEHMWVDPGQIGSGIGRALSLTSSSFLKRAGGTKLSIASDPNAEGFYRKLGARRVGSGRWVVVCRCSFSVFDRAGDPTGASRPALSQVAVVARQNAPAALDMAAQ